MIKLRHVVFLVFWLFLFIAFVCLCSVWMVDTPTWNIVIGSLFMFVIFHAPFSFILNHDAMDSKAKWDDYLLPFPKKVKFKKGLWWYLEAVIKPNTRRGRRKYCSECGCPVVYIDELYDENYIRESVNFNTVAVCSFCGIEYEEFDDLSGKRKATLPIKEPF